MAPTNPNQPSKKGENEKIERWRWMLDQDIPLIGGWMHRRIAGALTESAATGNWLAAQSLAVVFVFHEDESVRQLAGETLRRINYATGIDAVWGVWVDTRSPSLEEIVVAYNRTANHPASIRLYSVLRLSLENAEFETAITRGSQELIPSLIQACDDADARIAARAREIILKLQNSASVDVVCEAWRATRTPFLTEVLQTSHYVAKKPAVTRVLSALKTHQLDVIAGSSVEMIAPLINACQDEDAEIAASARQCLTALKSKAAVDELCRFWVETRNPLVEDALLQAHYLAQKPIPIRLLTALKIGEIEAAQQTPPEGLDSLLQAAADADAVIRANAALALRQLQDQNTINALCSRVIEKDDPQAKEIALTHGYLPDTPELRALFFFLTGQTAAYDNLDFDQSIMRAVYETAPAALRQRIAAHVQQASRTDYLTILAGVDLRAHYEKITPEEAALLIRILSANQEYERLWKLVTELSLPYGLQILQLLQQSHWQPNDEADQPIFEEMVRLSQLPMQITDLSSERSLPLAIPRSTLSVRGRVNDVAFSPNRPVVAIATSQHRVVLWNFKTAAVETVLRDFGHSVGKVAYTPQGWLVCAERTNNDSACDVMVYTQEEKFLLFTATGSITVLEPIGEDRLLTAGRDQQVILWDLPNRKKISEKEFTFWARSSAISADTQYAALLHTHLTLLKLPDLSAVPGFPYVVPQSPRFKRGVSQQAAFSPDGKYLLAGQYNGQVGMFYHTSLTQRPNKAMITQHSQPIRAVQFLPHHSIVLTAGAEGQVRFLTWPDAQMRGMVFAPDGQLTSLRISHQGAYMATGTNDASLVLWDLRVLDIPQLFSQPLAAANHDQIASALALCEYHALPETVRNGLMLLRALLQYRFRFDIQIDEAPTIQFGEFDILLEDEP